MNLRAFDGGLFHATTSSEPFKYNGFVSGAWIDGPLGFMQCWSGPRGHADLAVRSIIAGKPRGNFTIPSGSIEIGRLTDYRPTDMAVIGEFTYLKFEGKYNSFWGAGSQTVEEMGQLVDVMEITDHQSEGVWINPRVEGAFFFSNSEAKVVMTAADASIFQFHALTADDKARGSQGGLRTDAGTLTRSAEGPPRLRLLTDSVRVEVLIHEDTSSQDAVNGIMSFSEVSYAASPAR